MGSIMSRISALRVQRRDKRIERLGGHPAQRPEVTVEVFQPQLGHPARVENVVRGVSRLGAESVDEGTAYPLDNFLNAQGDEWQRRLAQQHYAYQAVARDRLRHLRGVVEQYRHLYEVDLRRLHDAEVAVESAMLALSGEPPGYADGAADPDAAGHGGTGRGGNGTADGDARDAQAVRRRRPRLMTGREPRDPLDGPAALAPSHVSRSELRRILEPRDASRVPHWAEPGFRDPTLLGGRPLSTYLHVLALLLAAGADIGAFAQVVELVLTQVSDLMTYIVVAGLTAVVLYIAHMIGVLFRDARARRPGPGGRRGWRQSRAGTWATAAVCMLAWGALGGLAYYVRTTVAPIGTAQVGGGSGGGVIGSGAIGSGTPAEGTVPQYTHQSAFLFLGLYAATGIVAALGAYFSHNPHRGRYVAALRAYRKAAERAAATANQLGRSEAGYQRQRTELENSDRILAEARELDKAFTEQLKQSVRLQIATMVRDPAVTDALFDEDHKPYWN